MRIAHLMLFNFFIDNAYYQENILPSQNKADGHDVLVIASTYVFGQGNSMQFIKPGSYRTQDDIDVIRVDYKKIINRKISEKVRAFKNVYKHLDDFQPDIIFSHGIGGYESATIARYVQKNPNTRLYIDCHSDFYNSARNFFSRNILHRVFYRYFFKKYERFAQKVYYVAPESIEFLQKLYGFKNPEKLEYLPLGGYITDEEKRKQFRSEKRQLLGISQSDTVIIHTGKFDKNKKSLDLLKAFTQTEAPHLKLIIIGAFNPDIYVKAQPFIATDDRIHFLGWKNGKELQEYLFASDIYIQPGSRTVSVQNAVCCGCVIITNRSLCYTHLFGENAIYADNEEEIANVLLKIAKNPGLIEPYKKPLRKIAIEKLDYKMLANKYL